MEKEKWSESSKRSFAYSGSSSTFYENISYRCTKCSRPSIFTAEDQKYAFEVLQQYIWKRRTLCTNCHLNYDVLRLNEKRFQEKWAANKKELRKNYQFLCDWLKLLEEVPSYGKRPHYSMIEMLKTLAHECE